MAACQKTIAHYRNLEKFAELEANGAVTETFSSGEINYIPDGIHSSAIPIKTEPSAADTPQPAVQTVTPILQQTDKAFRHNDNYDKFQQQNFSLEY